MIVDAALSGLVIDQYHRQCQQEMQRLIESANTDGKLGSELTQYDQRLCTHKAWYHLITQLLKDALLASETTSHASPLNSSGTASSLPSSPVKEVRSYNNLYVAYAQKVDIEELKQRLLLQHLEQEILSPNPDMTSLPMFSLADAARIRASRQQQGRSHDQGQTLSLSQQLGATNIGASDDGDARPEHYKQLASRLRHKLSSPKLHQQYAASFPDSHERDQKAEETGNDGYASQKKNRYGLVASLTQEALATFNRANGQETTVATPGSSAAPPTPTSIAALSIRSSSRNSNRNSSISGSTTGVQPSIGTPGSMPSPSGFVSPRITAAMNGLKRQGSVQSRLDSPQLQPMETTGKEGNKGASFELDYFNQTHVHHYPTLYHLHQMNSTNKKRSQLSQTIASASSAEAAGITTVSHSGDQVSTPDAGLEPKAKNKPELEQKQIVHGASDMTKNRRGNENGVDKRSGILIPLQDGDEDDDMDEKFEMMGDLISPEGIVGVVPEHSASVQEHLVPIKSSTALVELACEQNDGTEHGGSIRKDNTIDMTMGKKVSPDEGEQDEDDKSVVDDSQLQMLPISEEEETPPKSLFSTENDDNAPTTPVPTIEEIVTAAKAGAVAPMRARDDASVPTIRQIVTSAKKTAIPIPVRSAKARGQGADVRG
ncbi:hypothetical protein BCR41DRAFT_347317 [Lobosporangium transversale]|uniref:Uncharacterized protein n=1 Tax=Lobosporangium transversale TaxID=64571 RepID=A0A1Y2GXP1_9FUNG|nr:hypothetical protein BCR41DRAFT_347317 [Lobosporangium transversale]ORZ27050.1 hypothetical protein BCR41DRAFT_347317 [Lobosporangium transversale]|eukprot:XP_021884797.1 hypothetical protein BCR41DRAFT_347317 [Lobosporangium transversale]